MPNEQEANAIVEANVRKMLSKELGGMLYALAECEIGGTSIGKYPCALASFTYDKATGGSLDFLDDNQRRAEQLPDGRALGSFLLPVDMQRRGTGQPIWFAVADVYVGLEPPIYAVENLMESARRYNRHAPSNWPEPRLVRTPRIER